MVTRLKKVFHWSVKRKKKTIPGLIAIILFITIFAFWLNLISSIPEPVITFQENFDSGAEGWEKNDAAWIEAGPERKGAVKLSRSKYLAPYLMKRIETQQSPPETLVFSFSVRVHDFTEDGITLASLQFPGGPLAIVINRNGYLAVSDSLFSPPQYIKNFRAFLYRDQWENIYLFIDNNKKQVSLYLNSRKIMEKSYNQPSYPVQEIWLGAIWIKGGGNYGSPIDVSYDNVLLGNQGCLPRPELMTFARNSYFYLIDYVDRKQFGA